MSEFTAKKLKEANLYRTKMRNPQKCRLEY